MFPHYMKINLKVLQLWRHLPTPPSGLKFMAFTFIEMMHILFIYCKHVPTQSLL